jgi:hypothetical protein
MKRHYIVVLGILLFSIGSFAQKGNNSIGVGADLGLPTGEFGQDFKTGIGLYAKGMLGVSTSGQVTFTSGYSAFKEAGDWEDFTTTISIVPLLLGYRHYFTDFFVEPQLGYSILGAKLTGADGSVLTDTDGIFTWAAGIGYVFNKKVEVSGRYQSGSKKGSTLSFFGLRLGYNFSLGHSK